MRILPVEKIREADAYTIENEPVASVDLMERAAKQCCKWIRKRAGRQQEILVFCGPGNNGGDGLVIARLLGLKNYDVAVYILDFTENFSEDFNINLERLEEIDLAEIFRIKSAKEIDEIPDDAVIVDAIFGSGLARPVTGIPGEVIRFINRCAAVTIAIDVPSGLFADEHSAGGGGEIIEADYTLTFQYPKLAFLFPENDQYVGRWHVLPIGLMDEFAESVDVKNFTVDRKDATDLLKPRSRISHKGTYGHALLVSGGYGKMGAAVLASEAALRAGAGLVTTHIPRAGYPIIQAALPEAMVSIDVDEFHFSRPPDLAPYNAIAAGPGLGMAKATQQALKILIQNTTIPLLLDADALNILSENKTWISFLPHNSILTPHPREFERLFGKSANEFERNRKQREFSLTRRLFIVLKGANTCISTPEGKCFFNTTGNPGMATGGSGDVLTGIILGLLAQNYHPQEACILGVYLHGLAGDNAAKRLSQQAMIAGDITSALGKAFKIVDR
jgi:ADP-dependent NAD(P)H-hydrate dehydratase / NAD(P)H-hydrate epimerase